MKKNGLKIVGIIFCVIFVIGIIVWYCSPSRIFWCRIVTGAEDGHLLLANEEGSGSIYDLDLSNIPLNIPITYKNGEHKIKDRIGITITYHGYLSSTVFC